MSKSIFGNPVQKFSNLQDVQLNNLTNGQVPIWNASAQKWENGTSGGSGVTSFNSRTGVVIPVTNDYTISQIQNSSVLASTANVTITSPTNGQLVTYNATNNDFVNQNIPSISVNAQDPAFNFTANNTSNIYGLTFNTNSQSNNKVWAGPTTGSNTPTFRVLDQSDIVNLQNSGYETQQIFTNVTASPNNFYDMAYGGTVTINPFSVGQHIRVMSSANSTSLVFSGGQAFIFWSNLSSEPTANQTIIVNGGFIDLVCISTASSQQYYDVVSVIGNVTIGSQKISTNTLSQLQDSLITSLTNGNLLGFNGTNWINTNNAEFNTIQISSTTQTAAPNTFYDCLYGCTFTISSTIMPTGTRIGIFSNNNSVTINFSGANFVQYRGNTGTNNQSITFPNGYIELRCIYNVSSNAYWDLVEIQGHLSLGSTKISMLSMGDLQDTIISSLSNNQVVSWNGSNFINANIGGSPTQNQTVYVSKNGNDSNNGSINSPFLTIGAANTSITTASAIGPLRFVIQVSQGEYTENFALKANVFIVGAFTIGTRITGTITLNDASWNNANDNRSGFENLQLISAETFDFTTQSASAGKLYFYNVRTNALTFTCAGSINQMFLLGCDIFGNIIQTAGQLSMTSCIFEGTSVSLLASSITSNPTTFSANQSNGASAITATSNATNSISISLLSSYTSTLTLNGTGAGTILTATNDSLPLLSAITLTNGASITRLNDTNSLIYTPTKSIEWTTQPTTCQNALDTVNTNLNGLFLGPTQYTTGTAAMSVNIITGTSTTFIAAMVGGCIVFANGVTSLIYGFVSTTSLNAYSNVTVGAQAYTIYYSGTQIDSNGYLSCNGTINKGLSLYNSSANETNTVTGIASQTTTTVTATTGIFTSAMVGGIILYTGTTQKTVFITGYTSSTVVTVAESQSVSSQNITVFYGSMQSNYSGNTAINNLYLNNSIYDSTVSKGTSGQLLSSTGTKSQWINLPATLLTFTSVSNVVSGQYVGTYGVSATIGKCEVLMTRAGTLKNCYGWISAQPGGTAAQVFTLYQNGASTALALGFSATTTTSNNTSNFITVVAGDLITFLNTGSNSPAAAYATIS